MKIPASDADFVFMYDPYNYRNYSCIEYSVMGAAWLHTLGKRPVFSISMSNYDKSWGHTACEVPMLGTYDFYANIFFPDYFWHRRPVNEEDLSKITPAVAWDDNQKLDMIDKYYRYDTNTYVNKYIWTINTVHDVEAK